MADIFTANLAGASELFNNFLIQLDSIRIDILAGLEIEASTLASTLLTRFTSLTGLLQDFVPPVPDLPNINFQSEMRSLLGIDKTTPAGLAQYNAALLEVKANFEVVAEANGFDIDKLIVLAEAAGDETYSNIIPNFTRAADLLSPAFITANEVLQAVENGAKEKVSSFVVNPAVKQRIEELATV